MPLTLLDQLDVARSSWTTGEIDTLSRLLTEPDAVSFQDQKSTAAKLGLHGGFLSAAVNVVTDPMIWIAMLLSRRGPTSSFVRGTIPHRFIGTANEFTGLSYFSRTVEGFFRGTNIPGLISLKMRREAEVNKIGNQIFKSILERPNWKEEMPVVSMLLEGQKPAGATPELVALSGKIRGHMDDIWRMLHKTWKVSGGFDSPDGIRFATARPFGPSEAPRYLRDYLPHIPLYSTDSVLQISGKDAMKKLVSGRAAQAFQVAGRSPTEIWSVSAADRLSSDFDRYQEFMNRVGTQVFNPRLFRRMRHGVPLQSAEGEGLFITDLNIILQKYIHSAARTYALNAPLTQTEISLVRTTIEDAAGKIVTRHPTHEPIAVQIVNEGLNSAGPIRMIRRQVAGTNVLEEFIDTRSMNAPALGALKTLVREVRGQADEGEILIGNLWNAVRNKVDKGLGRILPPRQMSELEKTISHLQRDSQGADLSRRMTSFFYATTLGLNTSSAIKNLMQPALTTVPAIGLGPTLRGYSVLKERMPGYFRSFNRQYGLLKQSRNLDFVQKVSIAQERSFLETFPELAASGVKIDPRAFELSEAALTRQFIRSGRVRNRDQYYQLLMQPFMHTEMSNQIVTFYGAKQKLRNMLRTGELDVPTHVGTRAALSGADLEEFLNLEASRMVNLTQFRPGAGSRSLLQTWLPPPFRMFTSFPNRLANLFAESTVRGALTEAQLKQAGILAKVTGGRNLGLMARTYILGKAVNEGLREGIGVDLSDALGISGPFTGIVQSGKIFSPLTFSPLPRVMLGAASFASTRDLKDLNPLELPGVGKIPIPKTLVPAGIQISRMSRVLRAYRPDLGGFVDEDERLMYEGDTMDAIFGMMGVPLEKERRMRKVMDRTRANRMRIREYRRRYATAARNYDLDKMEHLSQAYQGEFPDLAPLAVGDKDIERYAESARMTAVQRTIGSIGKTMPFLEKDIYEFEPDLIAPMEMRPLGR